MASAAELIKEISTFDAAADVKANRAQLYYPPYRSDPCKEHNTVELQAQTKALLEFGVQTPHQEGLVRLVRKVVACPEPIPFLLNPSCPPAETVLARSEWIHALMQLISDARDAVLQDITKSIYKTYGSDHRAAARELYVRSLFPNAFIQYRSLLACLTCDKCAQLPSSERKATSADLYEKLAISCLRAGWYHDAVRFAQKALQFEKRSVRAVLWMAVGHMGLGELDKAQERMRYLLKPGRIPEGFPSSFASRIKLERANLARLERELQGSYDIDALETEPRARVSETMHATSLAHVELTPTGYRTSAFVPKDTLLIVAPPLVIAPCFTPDALVHDSKRRPTLHDEDPSLLTLARIADDLHEKAKSSADVRSAVLASGGLPAYEAVSDMIGNDLRAAAVVVAQTFSIALPHSEKSLRAAEAARATAAKGKGKQSSSASESSTLATGSAEMYAHAGHAVYLPTLHLARAPVTTANTYPSFHGPCLFLRASRSLPMGTVLTFDHFPKELPVDSKATSEFGKFSGVAWASKLSNTL